jgi:Mor family transcriptional regulator
MSKSNRVLIDAKDIPQDLKKLVGIVGSDKFFEIVKEYGGESIYIPKVDTFYRSDRNRKIAQEFNGSNYRELAKKYRLTDKMIRYILENKKDKRSHGSA